MSKIWVWAFFCELNLLGFFWCFVAEIFIFAEFIFGICWIYCTDWFVRSWHPFGWQENAVIAKKITYIFCYL